VLDGVLEEILRALPFQPSTVASTGHDRVTLFFLVNPQSIDTFILNIQSLLPPSAQIVEVSFLDCITVEERHFEISDRLAIRLLGESQRGKEKEEGSPAQPTVTIRACLSFGSGFHPTTRMSLVLLDRAFRRKPNIGRALDVGTGSGILALAAVRLEAGGAIALDFDFRALEEARQNAIRNNAQEKVSFLCGTLSAIRGTFDIVTANMAPGPIMQLASSLPRVVRQDGMLIVSGFFARQQDEILNALGPGTVLEAITSQGWHAVLWQRML
jgi:ribosomal protein L11 methylase PrmA